MRRQFIQFWRCTIGYLGLTKKEKESHLQQNELELAEADGPSRNKIKTNANRTVVVAVDVAARLRFGRPVPNDTQCPQFSAAHRYLCLCAILV